MFSEADRNTAPPAESAVWKRRRREHSGADRLNGAFAECGREVGRYVMRVKHKREEPMAGTGTFLRLFQKKDGSRRVVPRINDYSPRNAVKAVFRGLFMRRDAKGKETYHESYLQRCNVGPGQ